MTGLVVACYIAFASQKNCYQTTTFTEEAVNEMTIHVFDLKRLDI